jgi:tetratricopeptide (TPR) repeat protein
MISKLKILHVPMVLIVWMFSINTGIGQKDHLIAGNDAFKKGLYPQALEAYKKTENLGYVGAGLYTNMARIHAQLKNDAHAILYYEKALKITPNDEVLKTELSNIIKRNPELDELSDDFFLVRWWRFFSGLWLPDTWAILSFVMLAGAGLFILLDIKLPIIRQYRKYIVAGAFAFFIISTFAAYSRYKTMLDSGLYIIILPDAKLKAGPDDLSPEISPLPPGTKVRKKDNLGQWMLVISPFGDTGWIKTETMALI